MKALSNLPCISVLGCCWWFNGVGIFSWHILGPLVTAECHLNATAYLSIVEPVARPVFAFWSLHLSFWKHLLSSLPVSKTVLSSSSHLCKLQKKKNSCQIGFMFSHQLRAFFLNPPPQHIQILSNKNIAGCRFSTYTRYIWILENLLAEPMWFYSIIAKRCECNSTILSKSQDCSLATLKIDLI